MRKLCICQVLSKPLSRKEETEAQRLHILVSELALHFKSTPTASPSARTKSLLESTFAFSAISPA